MKKLNIAIEPNGRRETSVSKTFRLPVSQAKFLSEYSKKINTDQTQILKQLIDSLIASVEADENE